MPSGVEIKYSYKPVPTLRKFAQSSAWIRGILGPFGSGKSSACVIEIVKRGLMQKPGPDGIKRTRWLTVRNTFPQLRDTTIKTFMQWLPHGVFGEFKHSENRYIIKAFEQTEIEVLFRALDRPDHVSNLLSLEVTGCWANEAREIPWTIIDAIQGRIGRFPAQRDGGPTWNGLFLDTNPPDLDSKWYNFFEKQEHHPDHAQIFKQPSGLAPNAENLENLPGGRKYYERMAIAKDPEWIKVYIHGEYGWVVDGRPVYHEYLDSVHCSDKVKYLPSEPIYRGWDFGLTPSAIFVQVSPMGQLLVIDELTSDNMGIDRFGDEVIEHSSKVYPDAEWIDLGDPAGQARSPTDERTCFEILHSKGVMIEAGLQTPAIRLESVRKPLTSLKVGKPGFQLHPRCSQLRKGFMGGYCFRRLQTSAERYTEKPDKNQYSHIHDALQYVCTRIFGGGLTEPRLPSSMGITPSEQEFDEFPRSEITGY